MTVFVDTSAFYAVIDDRDPNNSRATRAFADFANDGTSLLTHEYVVVETTALIQRRLGLEALRRFVDDLLPVVEVEWVDAALHGAAREALRAAGRRTVSLVDWTSFIVMRRTAAQRAFAFDPDFADEGFEVIPAG